VSPALVIAAVLVLGQFVFQLTLRPPLVLAIEFLFARVGLKGAVMQVRFVFDAVLVA
jgi:hypothetical protein